MSEAIKVSTIDATSGRIIDSDELSAKIAATANEIPSVTVTACSDPQVRTGSYTGQVCTYQVRIRLGPDLAVKANSLVEIDIPPEIDIQSS